MRQDIHEPVWWGDKAFADRLASLKNGELFLGRKPFFEYFGKRRKEYESSSAFVIFVFRIEARGAWA